MNNELLAKVIFQNNLASKDQIQELWPQVTPDADIAKLLVKNGVLPEKYYDQVVKYVQQLEGQQTTIKASEDNAREDNARDFEGDSTMEVRDASVASHPSSPGAYLDNEKKDNEKKDHESHLTPPQREVPTSIPSADPQISSSASSEPAEPAELTTQIDNIDSLGNNSSFYGSSHVDSPTQHSLGLSADLVETKFKDNLTERLLRPKKTDLAPHQKPITSPASDQDSPSHSTRRESRDRIKAAADLKGKPQDHDNHSNQDVQEVLPKQFHGQRGEGDFSQSAIDRITSKCSLFQILEFARRQSASDVHISANNKVKLRQFGVLKNFSEEILTQAQVEKIIRADISEADIHEFLSTGDYETVITIPGSGRFRATFMVQRSGWDFAARVISKEIMSLKQIGMPDSCIGLTKWAQGLVLVTGPVGCGKTTTLSTLVQMVNESRNDHIITVESPVEVVYPKSSCQMTQREVGLHTLSPANALKGALRQDPDILVVSELRDLETIELAVSAAETGHLVFGTMNTTNAARTITRLVDSFPADEQDIIRSMLSESLRGVICQQMLPLKQGTGVVPAFEVLLITPPVANIIRKNEIHQLESAMITGRSQGMVLLDNSLQELIDQDLVHGKDCYYRANNPKNFEKFLKEEEGI